MSLNHPPAYRLGGQPARARVDPCRLHTVGKRQHYYSVTHLNLSSLSEKRSYKSTYEATPHSEQEARKMLDKNLQARRDWFTDKLKETANKKNVPIDDTFWYDIANKDAAEFVIRSRGKRKQYQIDNFDLISKPDDYLEQCVEQIVDSLS
jgi:hypothetical protein